MEAKRLRLGVDTGGTFTDAVIMTEDSGEFTIDKVPSTPSDPSVSLHQIIRQSLDQVGGKPEEVTYLVHGTTVATNSIIEGKTAKGGLLTTEGFRDILEIARQIKPEPFNIFFEKPRPLIPRHLCLEVEERMDFRGMLVKPLSAEGVSAAAEVFRREGVESIAVCFLHSYLNPAHERAAGEILSRALPGVPISLSSEVCPEFREYFRASTTVVNAVITPTVGGYLNRMEAKLRDLGFGAQLCIMQSNGGIYTSEIARRKPVHIVESGPAAGVIVAAHIGLLTGCQNVISLDIGGTTAKAGLIQNGVPKISNDFEVGAKATGHLLHAKATGYPIKSGVIDLVEIGAGGGSIGWVDSGGALRVGPKSAGADPGPACYGWGGALPTLTDANLALGRLNSEFFLGGKMKLSVEAAREAIERELAKKLRLNVTETALGMIEIANSNMIEALRLISVQRGFDPREFALVAFGGAGPLHANAIAGELGVSELIVPLSPGVSSALGLLLADVKHDFVRTYIRPLNLADLDFLNRALADFEEEGRAVLTREGIPEDKQSFAREMDLRYAGQSFELKIPIPADRLKPEHLSSLEAAFHRYHERAYGHSTPGEPVEMVNLRVTAKGIIPKPKMKQLAEANGHGGSALKGVREVCFQASEGFRSTPIYERYKLLAGEQLAGPAIVEEFDSTVVIHPGYRASVDRFGSIHIVRV
jgi:N-methylhydantoinase A